MNEFMNAVNITGWDVLIVPTVLMLLDIITGFVNAWSKKEISSSKLRKGISHKVGEIVMIVVPVFLTKTIELPNTITTFIVCYIIVMEIISIIENLEKLGIKTPKIITDKLEEMKGNENEQKKV